MSESDDWKQRLKNEYLELSDRIQRLDSFIESVYESDDDVVRSQLSFMHTQLRAMCVYRDILSYRARLAGIEL